MSRQAVKSEPLLLPVLAVEIDRRAIDAYQKSMDAHTGVIESNWGAADAMPGLAHPYHVGYSTHYLGSNRDKKPSSSSGMTAGGDTLFVQQLIADCAYFQTVPAIAQALSRDFTYFKNELNAWMHKLKTFVTDNNPFVADSLPEFDAQKINHVNQINDAVKGKIASSASNIRKYLEIFRQKGDHSMVEKVANNYKEIVQVVDNLIQISHMYTYPAPFHAISRNYAPMPGPIHIGAFPGWSTNSYATSPCHAGSAAYQNSNHIGWNYSKKADSASMKKPPTRADIAKSLTENDLLNRLSIYNAMNLNDTQANQIIKEHDFKVHLNKWMEWLEEFLGRYPQINDPTTEIFDFNDKNEPKYNEGDLKNIQKISRDTQAAINDYINDLSPHPDPKVKEERVKNFRKLYNRMARAATRADALATVSNGYFTTHWPNGLVQIGASAISPPIHSQAAYLPGNYASTPGPTRAAPLHISACPVWSTPPHYCAQGHFDAINSGYFSRGSQRQTTPNDNTTKMVNTSNAPTTVTQLDPITTISPIHGAPGIVSHPQMAVQNYHEKALGILQSLSAKNNINVTPGLLFNSNKRLDFNVKIHLIDWILTLEKFIDLFPPESTPALVSFNHNDITKINYTIIEFNDIRNISLKTETAIADYEKTSDQAQRASLVRTFKELYNEMVRVVTRKNIILVSEMHNGFTTAGHWQIEAMHTRPQLPGMAAHWKGNSAMMPGASMPLHINAYAGLDHLHPAEQWLEGRYRNRYPTKTQVTQNPPLQNAIHNLENKSKEMSSVEWIKSRMIAPHFNQVEILVHWWMQTLEMFVNEHPKVQDPKLNKYNANGTATTIWSDKMLKEVSDIVNETLQSLERYKETIDNKNDEVKEMRSLYNRMTETMKKYKSLNESALTSSDIYGYYYHSQRKPYIANQIVTTNLRNPNQVMIETPYSYAVHRSG